MSARDGIQLTFTIGRGSWEQEIRYYTAEMCNDYWSAFQRVSAEDIERIERETARKLPEDFKEFLRVFGCGGFPLSYGGDISDPEEIILGGHSHLWMMLGSADWASPEDQRRFYVTRGAFNPAPKKYTSDALLFEDVSLLDLLQIGSNGGCCYHQLYVGKEPSSLGYCLLTPEQTMDDVSPSFSEGLKLILTHHWQWGEPEELPGGLNIDFELQ